MKTQPPRMLTVFLSAAIIGSCIPAAAMASQEGKIPQTLASQVSAAGEDYLPLRAFCEWVGIPVDWNEAKRTVTAAKDKHVLSFVLAKPGMPAADLEGIPLAPDEVILLDSTAYIKRETAFKAFGIEAAWRGGKLEIPTRDLAARARAFVTQLQKNNRAGTDALTNGAFKEAGLPEGTVQLVKQLAQLPITQERIENNAVHRTVILTSESPQMNFDLEIRFDKDGYVDDFYAGMSFAGYKAPSYDKPGAYSERRVVIGTGGHAVEGTLTVPAGMGPFPLVILLQGDGELDRDSTVFAQKPFRDLAVGLANHQVATLRIDKTTREHFAQLNGHYTIGDEFVEPVLAAVKAARLDPDIDPGRIYAAGHSRGGWMIPRLLARDTDSLIQGAIVLAGADPRYTEIDSYEHEELGGMIPKEQLAYYREQLKLVKADSFDPKSPPAAFELPPNPYWWHDIRSYSPAEEAKLRSAAMLVLQGEEDFQVPLASLNGWKEVYAGNAAVTYKTYPKLTHLFTEGKLENGIGDYKIPANVPDTVVSDIGAWINGSTSVLK
ncbi:stalk domain-containing protein [Paenibacillus chitinolyticus]|uniref:alpha/beta hydrolase family protein n=1 Tax=Paenibacillus chitinolyticus TaxID=79263 RepID=UPI002DB68ECB|nr:stalk domain-containing protein [Paenibacillus chitinolyticus]MEC0247977.1 stalk domain-containing protein [Paenibacillus chitinolyticus]